MERRFDQQIDHLKQQLLLMSGRAESIIRKAVEALMRRDPALADEVERDIAQDVAAAVVLIESR